MVKLIVALFVLSLTAPALAADIDLRWTGSTGADGYRVSQSLDQGSTWNQVADTPHNPAVPIDAQTVALTGVPETGLVLFRVSAYNTVGETIRVESGAWYNQLWQVPAFPSGLGVN